MADTIEHVSQNYPIPTREYLLTELTLLSHALAELEQFVGGGPECLCIDNEPPPEDPADNGCDCNPCNCPTDKHPCYEGSEFNNGDRSNAGLRRALERLQRQANALLAEHEAGGACVCAARARAGKPLINRLKPPVSKRKPPIELYTKDETEDETEEPSGDQTGSQSEEASGDQTGSQSEEASADQTGSQSEEASADQTASLTEEQTASLTASLTDDQTQNQTQGESSYDISTVTPVAPRARKRPREEREYRYEDSAASLGPFRDRFASDDGLNFS